MPAMQKAFIIQGLYKAGEYESADYVVGNLEPLEVANVLQMLRNGVAEQQLQQATAASHGELSRRLAEASNECDELRNKLAQVPSDLKLLTILCCERAEVDTVHERVIFVPGSVEMHNGELTLFGLNEETKMGRRFTTDQIVRFTALRASANTDSMSSP